tara:strand:- start:161 stop:355 length:195 start_codon:yes stop_codon:yes gene_type:complete
MRTNGKENKNLPAYAIIIAKIIDKIIVINLIPFEIFLLDVFTNQLSKKYTMTKIISVMKKIFMY